jgi:hypothetical protein
VQAATSSARLNVMECMLYLGKKKNGRSIWVRTG